MPKFVSVQEAAAQVKDGMTVTIKEDGTVCVD